MDKNILVIIAGIVLFVSGLAFAHMSGTGGSCCSLHSVQNKIITVARRGNNMPVIYVCPMHPEVKSNEPGKCPKCGMNLEPVNKDA